MEGKMTLRHLQKDWRRYVVVECSRKDPRMLVLKGIFAFCSQASEGGGSLLFSSGQSQGGGYAYFFKCDARGSCYQWLNARWTKIGRFELASKFRNKEQKKKLAFWAMSFRIGQGIGHMAKR